MFKGRYQSLLDRRVWIIEGSSCVGVSSSGAGRALHVESRVHSFLLHSLTLGKCLEPSELFSCL